MIFLRVVFVLMALVLGGGFVVGLIASTPVFNNGSGYRGPESEILDSIEVLRENQENAEAVVTLQEKPKNKEARALLAADEDFLEALQVVGSGYYTLATQPGGEVETQDGPVTYPDPTDAQRQRYMDRAIRAFSTYRLIDPADEDTSFQLAAAYEGQQEFGKASAVYEALAAERTDDKDVLWAWGVASYQDQDTATAVLVFNEFIELAPNDARAEQAREIVDSLSQTG